MRGVDHEVYKAQTRMEDLERLANSKTYELQSMNQAYDQATLELSREMESNSRMALEQSNLQRVLKEQMDN